MLFLIVLFAPLWMQLLHNLVAYNFHLCHLILWWLIHAARASSLSSEWGKRTLQTLYLIFQSLSTSLWVPIISCSNRLKGSRYHVGPVGWDAKGLSQEILYWGLCIKQDVSFRWNYLLKVLNQFNFLIVIKVPVPTRMIPGIGIVMTLI